MSYCQYALYVTYFVAVSPFNIAHIMSSYSSFMETYHPIGVTPIGVSLWHRETCP